MQTKIKIFEHTYADGNSCFTAEVHIKRNTSLWSFFDSSNKYVVVGDIIKQPLLVSKISRINPSKFDSFLEANTAAEAALERHMKTELVQVREVYSENVNT